MAPQGEQFSAPGSASYGSDTMAVGDGTWDYSKNNFLLPNLQGLNFETMRYNGMGNRFATLPQYHRIVLAHAVMAALVFLLFVPVAVMLARFYSREPGYAIVYHAQLHVLSGLLLLAVFILGFFAVGPERSLTNPHHGIGVAIFVLFILQLVGGRLVRHISKLRSLRIMIHQWSGRAIALLGIVQVPLGLALYGSPKYLFVLYALWMAFLLLVYFILSYRSGGRRELYMDSRSEGGHTRVTESEYFSRDPVRERSSSMKWLGPLAAGAGLWALLSRDRGDKAKPRAHSPTRSRSFISSRGPEMASSRRGSESYVTEKYSEAPKRGSGGGGFAKILTAAAAALGAGKLVSGMMNRRNDGWDEEYSAVSTDTPRRQRSGRGDVTTVSNFSSDYTDHARRPPSETETSLLPPSAYPAGRGAEPRRPITPEHLHARGWEINESDYSSYVSPSRRPPGNGRGGGGGGGGLAKGIMGGLGIAWFNKKLAERRARKEEERLREEEDMRSGVSGSRYTGDGFPSPTRRNSRRPPPPIRRGTGHPGTTITDMSEMSSVTESTVETRPIGNSYAAGPPAVQTGAPGQPPFVPVPGPGPHAARSRSRSRSRRESVSMPPMPVDPHGLLHHSEADSYMSSEEGRPRRRDSSRRRRAGERAAAAAAIRAGQIAASERDHHGSHTSRPVSVKVKMHEGRDKNVTLRRLTEDEARATRGPPTGRGRSRADSESSLSGLESPSHGRGYRRDSGQRRAERSAERQAEEDDQLAPLSPPHPSFAKGGGRRTRESDYSSGQAGPSSGMTPAGHQPASSLASESHGTWSAMSASPGGRGTDSVAADDRRRRRRLERRGAGSSRPSEVDMFD